MGGRGDFCFNFWKGVDSVNEIEKPCFKLKSVRKVFQYLFFVDRKLADLSSCFSLNNNFSNNNLCEIKEFLFYCLVKYRLKPCSITQSICKYKILTFSLQ